MNVQKIFAAFILVVGLVPASFALAQNENINPDEIPGEEFYRGIVLEVLDEERQETEGGIVLNQLVKVRIESGNEAGKEIEIENSGVFTINAGQGVEVGDKVIIYKVSVQGDEVYYIADDYRLPSILILLGLFFAVALIFSRWKGLASIFGLAVTVLVIVKFVIPQIMAGQNAILISLGAALIIVLVSVYPSHGFNKRTSVAIVATLITLLISAGLAVMFVSMGKLFGMGTDEAFYLQFGPQNIDLQGLLLCGILLGVLGVLDDVTTTQAAAVEEIKKANQSLNLAQLYRSGTSVGREHITSLVNTLFLAYAGVGLPLFLFFTTINPQPLWVTLNSQFIAEEIMRTLVGSISLMLAVPITTILAAYVFTKTKVSSE